MSHPLQNWRGECGRGPSLEHPVTGGYCVACDRIKAADALAKVVSYAIPRGLCSQQLPEIKDALATYEKVRGK